MSPETAHDTGGSEPTRIAILRQLDRAPRPVSVRELADRFGLHHSSVRAHLDRLLEDELVSAARDAQARTGRPRTLYRVTPRAARVLDVTADPYVHLASLLAEMVRTGETARDVGRADGRRAASGRSDGTDDGAERLTNEMGRLGFDPALRADGPGAEIVLRTCSHEQIASRAPRIVCDLHLGYAEGFAEALGDVRVAALETQDPTCAQCVLAITRAQQDTNAATRDEGAHR